MDERIRNMALGLTVALAPKSAVSEGSLEQAWEAWARRDVAYPFMLRGWLETCRKTHPQKPLERTLMLRQNGLTIGILPLALAGSGLGARRLFFAGEGASDYQTLLGAERSEMLCRQALEQLLAYDDWDYTELYPLRQYDLTLIHKAWNRPDCLIDQEIRGICPSLILDKDWESRIEPHVRKDVLYQKRRLEKQGLLEIRSAEHYTDLRYFLSILFKLHIKRWRLAGKRSKYQNRLNQQRCYRLARIWFDHGLLDLQVLFYNRQALAVHLGARTAERTYYYVPTFDPEWKKHSPGKILLWHLIHQSAEKGIRYFDFLRGAEGYKKDWGATLEEPYGCLRLYRNTPKGKAFRLMLAARS